MFEKLKNSQKESKVNYTEKIEKKIGKFTFYLNRCVFEKNFKFKTRKKN